jgi:hypothetical protein
MGIFEALTDGGVVNAHCVLNPKAALVLGSMKYECQFSMAEVRYIERIIRLVSKLRVQNRETRFSGSNAS